MTEYRDDRMPGRRTGSESLYNRQRIVSAARTVFTDFGFDAATYQLIARRAGLTRPAVNYHFPDKADLYREVFDESMSELVRAAIARAQTKPTLAAQLMAMATTNVEAHPRIQRDSAFVATSVAEVRRHPELLTPDSGIADMRLFLTRAVEAATMRGELAPETATTAMVDLLLAMLWGISIFGGLGAGPNRLKAMGEQFHALLPRPHFTPMHDGVAVPTWAPVPVQP